MLKAALTFLAIATGSTVAVVTGNTIYSAFQFQWPMGTALKVAPDPANLWSWHKEITLPANYGGMQEPILVDFDQNGRMDTEYDNLRVLITDFQITVPVGTNQYLGSEAWLMDGAVKRWRLGPATGTYTDQWRWESHLSTPLVLAPHSQPALSLQGSSQPVTIVVAIIGRVVTL